MPDSPFIPAEEYLKIISQAKITCIDLILRNPAGEILLGYRNNEPAKNSWFVPGSGIKKLETVPEIIQRIGQTEIGQSIPEPSFYALAQHDYEENFMERAGISSNFIVIAYAAEISDSDLIPDTQHNQLKWWPVEELLSSKEVHPITKAYFQPSPPENVILFRL